MTFAELGDHHSQQFVPKQVLSGLPAEQRRDETLTIGGKSAKQCKIARNFRVQRPWFGGSRLSLRDGALNRRAQPGTHRK